MGPLQHPPVLKDDPHNVDHMCMYVYIHLQQRQPDSYVNHLEPYFHFGPLQQHGTRQFQAIFSALFETNIYRTREERQQLC